MLTMEILSTTVSNVANFMVTTERQFRMQSRYCCIQHLFIPDLNITVPTPSSLLDGLTCFYFIHAIYQTGGHGRRNKCRAVYEMSVSIETCFVSLYVSIQYSFCGDRVKMAEVINLA